MNPAGFESQAPLRTPEQELQHLRQAAAERLSAARESGVQLTPTEAAQEKIRQYAAVPAAQVLHAEATMPAAEARAIRLDLSPESHDKQMEELAGLVETKGIRNAIDVVEGMKNPHLLDDFHRFLVQLVASNYPLSGLAQKDELWKPLHMTLYEVSLPETSEADKQRDLSQLISGMEQLYAGLLSISNENQAAGFANWFSIEIANANGSDHCIFYVSVPTVRRELFEKQVLAVFPGAHIQEQKDDYNIFAEGGRVAASYATLAKPALYPLKSYQEFNVDPLNAILNSFSKLSTVGEGAAIQFILGQRQDGYAKEGAKVIEKIKKGIKVKDALGEIDGSLAKSVISDFMSMFKSQDAIEKEKADQEKRAQAYDDTAVTAFTRKIKTPLVATNIRIVASAATQSKAESILHDLESSFNQFEDGHGNALFWKKIDSKRLDNILEQFTLRTYDEGQKLILGLEEVTTCAHFPASNVHQAAPQLKQSKAGTAPAPIDAPKQGTLIGINRHRGQDVPVYIAPEDRMRHLYVIGQTGTGKTTLVKNMIIQDIQAGNGVCFIDPHGTDIMDILATIPASRYDDLVYFDPASTERPMALNMLEYDTRYPEQKTFVVNEMFSIFQKLYGAVPESMGPVFEQYFRNATGLVIEDPESGSTLLDVSRVMSNKTFRELKLSRCKNPVIVQFWREIAEKAGGEAALANVVPYITSKFDVFLANEIMRPIIAQQHSSFNMREIMDGKKILLVNLSKGRLGDINSHLIGLILVGKILMAALSRVDASGAKLADFYLYLDEFQNITTDSIAAILSEARKYRLSLTLAHQFIGQLDDKIKDAVFGNVGSMASFRVGTDDAEFLEKQFAPEFTRADLINLDNFNAYVRLLFAGRPSKAFNIATLPPAAGNSGQVDKLRELSSLLYGRRREEVEAEIMKKYATLK